MTRWILLVPLLCALGCTAVRETQPERTATEQLIISSAVVDAARQIKADAVAGKKVVVDVTYLKTVDVEFTQGELRDRLLHLGAQLVTSEGTVESHLLSLTHSALHDFRSAGRIVSVGSEWKPGGRLVWSPLPSGAAAFARRLGH